MTVQAWYLIHSKPRQEETALVNLKRQGFEVYLPRIRATVRRAGRYRERIEPMFPRYLFVHLAAGEQDWRPIRSTVGVSTLVRFGTWPAIVPDDLVAGLREHTDESGVVAGLARPAVEPGTSVAIIDGILAGYRGIVFARNSQERVSVLLEVAGRQTRASLSIHQVARV